jgi:methylmalonyl-CoA epimerase
VVDIEQKLQEMKSQDIKLIDEVPKIGASGKKIAFVHPKSMGGVLIELEEL